MEKEMLGFIDKNDFNVKNHNTEKYQKRICRSFDFNWRFKREDIKEAKNIDYEDVNWRRLDLPHDWSIEGEYKKNNPAGIRGGFLPAGSGWYRKYFEIPEDWLSRKVFIEFDGIYINSDVWINGKHLGHRSYGYIGFEYDLTPYLKKGSNVIAVRVDNARVPSGRWYTGSGIYRHTWLKVTEKIYVSHWGIKVTTPEINPEKAKIMVKTSVTNDSSKKRRVTLISDIKNQTGDTVNCIKTEKLLPDKREAVFAQEITVPEPELWSPDNPYLYTLHTYIKEDGELIDDNITTFGIRYFDFDPDHGFSLNGKSMKLKGVCNHHEAGPVGAAVPDRVLERRLLILKEMGCNAVRTSHKPMAPEFYQMCNRLGMIVMDEAFDGWDEPKAKYDYGLYFADWWQTDLRDFIKRDRNHPCVIIWSIGNEVPHMNTEMTEKLISFIHKYDGTRPVTCGIDNTGENSETNRKILDIAGYNGGRGACFILEDDHEKYPERKFIKTEVPHTYQTRGVYQTQTYWRDENNERIEIEDLTEEEIFTEGPGAPVYNSSYDNAGIRISARDSWRQTRDLSFISGEFRWTGFDYLGEAFPTKGWPTRMSNFGIIDLCGFPKDHYYFYKSQWTEKPMIHILPHWTHPGKEGVKIPVWVYTNCDSVKLYLNDELIGEKEVGDKMHLSWDIPYQPGVLKAEGYRKGAKVVSDIQITAEQPHDIRLQTDNQNLKPDKRDISHLAFTVVDQQGSLVPTAANKIYFRIKGPVKKLGFDNGDPLDLTPHQVNYRRVFSGLGLGIFQSTSKKGHIEINAGGILGNSSFMESTKVKITTSRILLRGSLKNNDDNCKIYYTLNGSEPDRNSPDYKKPFSIDSSCTIKAVIYEENEKMMELEQEFKKEE